MAPAGDEEVHPDDGQVEEDEEQDQVEAGEHAEAGRLEEQQQRGEGAGSQLLTPGVEGAAEEDAGGEQQQRQAQAVDADVVAAVHAGDPLQVALVGEVADDAAARGVAQPQSQREQQLDTGDGHQHGARRDVGQPGERCQHDGGEDREEHQQVEHAHLTRRSRTVAATSSAAAWP